MNPSPDMSVDQTTSSVVDDWCDAEIFRQHVIYLMRSSGLHWRLIAAQANIAPSAMHHLLHGRDGRRPRTIHVTLARAIMQIDLDNLTTADKRRTYVGNARELLHALHTLGYTNADLRPWLTTRDLQLSSPSHRRTIYLTVAAKARIQACYDLLTSPNAQTAPQPAPVDCAAS